MSETRSSRPGRAAPSPAPAAQAPSITPVFPLLLLRTLRDHDRPEEVLEDEDLTRSMPRRFGLSDVVLLQIHRLEQEVRRRNFQSAEQVEDLIRLVSRRADTEQICRQAGQRVAQHEWQHRSPLVRRPLGLMPGPLALLAAQRATRRLFRRLVGNARFSVQRRPIQLRISGSLTARADPTGAACAFYAGALEELVQQYTGGAYPVTHPRCETRGDEQCEWTVQESA